MYVTLRLRYEILIIFLRLRQKKRNAINPLQPYDVFISFNDNDDAVRTWINKFLEPNLAKTGYNVFNPSRDIAYGAERDAEVISTISNTRNFLLVLTDSYLTEPVDGQRSWTENEWKYGWNQFKSDRSKNIVLVNFDHASSFDVEHRQIMAFLRVGTTVQFKNNTRNIMEEIHRKLGKPFPVIESKYDSNSKQVFPKDIFLTKTEQEHNTEIEMLELGKPCPLIESKYDSNSKQVFPKNLFLAKTEHYTELELQPNKQNSNISLHMTAETNMYISEM
jgi:hypothetical protein